MLGTGGRFGKPSDSGEGWEHVREAFRAGFVGDRAGGGGRRGRGELRRRWMRPSPPASAPSASTRSPRPPPRLVEDLLPPNQRGGFPYQKKKGDRRGTRGRAVHP